MSTHKLLFCLGIVFLFEATAPATAAAPSTDLTARSVTITDANDAAATTVRPKKKAKKAKKRAGKKGCEAYNS